ncbi:MAG: UDP-N-acetylglucosamine 2-epimerase (non-hydrolyzing) [Acidobacteria bacterium]|nr:UDP-N-acetylglucosamine 2-epimerase (non-hydrolyzing) [Acidobacteriota bacterium]
MAENKLKIMCIVGARPNFMKIAPIMSEIKKRSDKLNAILVHTGQHYDELMSDAFFADLEIPKPDINLAVGSGSHAEQTAKIMLAFESVVLEQRPDWVIVVGDVNSTMACTLVCSKLAIKVAHVEAGLRSFDHSMPEEINRLVTDVLVDLLLTPSRDGDTNLLREGVSPEKIKFVGNVMIDTLYKYLPKARTSKILNTLNIIPFNYGVVTLHRPSNVDDKKVFQGILEALGTISGKLPLIFPIHPRTRERIKQFKLDRKMANYNIKLIEPLGYLDFLQLYSNSRMVLTDSGGVQEETTVLGIPCLTLRENTERPITIKQGTNRLLGTKRKKIEQEAFSILNQPIGEAKKLEFWDGRAAERIIDAIISTKN